MNHLGFLSRCFTRFILEVANLRSWNHFVKLLYKHKKGFKGQCTAMKNESLNIKLSAGWERYACPT